MRNMSEIEKDKVSDPIKEDDIGNTEKLLTTIIGKLQELIDLTAGS